MCRQYIFKETKKKELKSVSPGVQGYAPAVTNLRNKKKDFTNYK
jgi:hypothetical protein